MVSVIYCLLYHKLLIHNTKFLRRFVHTEHISNNYFYIVTGMSPHPRTHQKHPLPWDQHWGKFTQTVIELVLVEIGQSAVQYPQLEICMSARTTPSLSRGFIYSTVYTQTVWDQQLSVAPKIIGRKWDTYLTKPTIHTLKNWK